MANELMPLSDVQAKLREKVQAAMLELIPPDVFDKFIEQAWDSFIKPRPEVRDGYDRNRVITPAAAPEIVRLLRAEIDKVLIAKIAEWAAEWAKNPEADAIAMRALKEIAAVASQDYIAAVGREIVSRTLSLIPNSFTRCGGCQQNAPRNVNCPSCGRYNG